MRKIFFYFPSERSSKSKKMRKEFLRSKKENSIFLKFLCRLSRFLNWKWSKIQKNPELLLKRFFKDWGSAYFLQIFQQRLEEYKAFWWVKRRKLKPKITWRAFEELKREILMISSPFENFWFFCWKKLFPLFFLFIKFPEKISWKKY